MSDPNQTRQELFDVDGDDDAQYSDTTSTGHNIKKAPSTNTTTSPVVRASAPFTLPDGRMIDCKNTLQSFDTAVVVQQPQHLTNATTSSLSTVKPSPTPSMAPLVNDAAQRIDTRRDNPNAGVEQNFHVNSNNAPVANNGIVNNGIVRRGSNNAAQNNNHNDIASNRIHINNHTNNAGTVAVHAEAVAVRSFAVVDAEILDSQLDDLNRPNSSVKRGISGLTVVIIVILACAATGAGVLCVTGNCSGGGDSVTTNSNTASPGASPPIFNSTVIDTRQPSTINPIKTPSSLPTTTPTSTVIVPSNPPTRLPTTSPATEAPTLEPTIRPVFLTDSPVLSLPPIDDLLVACSFLSMANLTLCQSITLFNTIILGNTIPSQIGWLTQLTSLDFSDNKQ